MSALKEFVAKHVGLYAVADGVPGGPHRIVSARDDGGVIRVTLDTPSGAVEVRSEQCVITAKQ